MHKPIKYVEKAVTAGASAAWFVFDKLNQINQNPSFTPAWSDKPLLKSYEKQKPKLGWPRETDSLCPRCVPEIRQQIIDGKLPHQILLDQKVGELKATIVERDGKIMMVKECPKHGLFEDVMSIDPAFFKHLEDVFPGRDIRAHNDEKLHNHGTSTILHGRGSVLTIDLTNRCNMMCDPCFMDANQVGFVHELAWEEVEKILGDAMSIEPRRQMSVQFSGGEPTLSPHFLRAVRHAKDIGFFCVQAATNGIRFAQDPDFARAAKDAGMRLAYLQFDGVGEEANAHRKVGNLFDVKLRAIENLHAAGIDVVLVVTVVRGVNDDQVGQVVRFAVANADKITVVSFQPVSFTGRDEDVSDDERRAKRYTLSHLAHDLARQLDATELMRDWFPLSALGPFGDLTDLMLADRADWGALKCGCHPNCGIGTVLFVNKRTKEMVPLTQFLDLEQLLKDVGCITDGAQPRPLAMGQVALALLKNFDPTAAPRGFTFYHLIKQFLSQTGNRGGRVGEYESDSEEFEWRLLFVAGMWFQDLYNYDFRRTEMCIIPYGTQMGEISFCAYNTGVGWRQVIEQMRANATVAEWYRTKGRHPVYAKNQELPLPPSLGTISMPEASE